jgi:adenylylsulfate kinase
MGLPGSGKTTLAGALQKRLLCPWLNADEVRKANSDWDFSTEGRIRQATRLFDMAASVLHPYVVVDFVAGLEEQRSIFQADFTIWMDTIQEGRYADTNSAFQPPSRVDLHVTTFDTDRDVEEILRMIYT